MLVKSPFPYGFSHGFSKKVPHMSDETHPAPEKKEPLAPKAAPVQSGDPATSLRKNAEKRGTPPPFMMVSQHRGTP